MIYRPLTLLLAVTCLVAVNLEAEDAVNLIANNDFSLTNAKGEPVGWHYSIKNLDKKSKAEGSIKFSVSKDVDDSETPVLKMTCDMAEQRVELYIPVKRETIKGNSDKARKYQLSADIRWDLKDQKGKVRRPTFYFVPSKGDVIKLKADNEWHRCVVDYTVAAGKKNLELKLQGARIPGEIFIKNLVLSETK